MTAGSRVSLLSTPLSLGRNIDNLFSRSRVAGTSVLENDACPDFALPAAQRAFLRHPLWRSSTPSLTITVHIARATSPEPAEFHNGRHGSCHKYVCYAFSVVARALRMADKTSGSAEMGQDNQSPARAGTRPVHSEVQHVTADQQRYQGPRLPAVAHASLIGHCDHMDDDFGGLTRSQSPGGMTSHSDEDPFKYDNEHYANFLKPYQEREVSAALHRVSGLSLPNSDATFCTLERCPSRPPIPTIAEPAVQHDGLTRQQDGLARLPSTHVDDRVATTATRAGDAAVFQYLATQAGLFQVAGPVVGGSESGWETVVTSNEHYDVNRACASAGTLLSGVGNAKVTSNSIADYSDFGSVPMGGFDGTGDDYPSTGGYRTRASKDKETARPVFVPKVRNLTGSPQDSTGAFAKTAVTAAEQGRALASQPFPIGVSMKEDDLGNPFRTLERSNRFDFRDSMTTDDASGAAEEVKATKAATLAADDVTDPDPPRGPEGGFACTDVNSSLAAVRSDGSGFDFSSKFEFELIPLEEAQRRHALRRAAGEDETVTGGSALRRCGDRNLHTSLFSQRTVTPWPGSPGASPLSVSVPAAARCRLANPSSRAPASQLAQSEDTFGFAGMVSCLGPRVLEIHGPFPR